ncbi:MAG: WG repeat-containing protein [Bacteroidetes bacterium]|nr:WG repeat-containing protein [Bacteroidota bacterium]
MSRYSFLFFILPVLFVQFNCTQGYAALKKNTSPFDSLFEAHTNGKWGWIDRKGNTAIPFIFDSILWHGWNAHNRTVIFHGKTGVIDSSGKFILQPLYDEVWEGSGDSIFSARIGRKFGLVTGNGKILIPFKYEHLYNSHAPGDSIYEMEIKNRVGLITKTGKEIIPPRFDRFGSFWNCGTNYYGVGFDWGIVHLDGTYERPIYNTEIKVQEALPACRPDTFFGDLHNGLRLVQVNVIGKTGFMRSGNSWVIPPEYDDAKDFSEGLAAVTADGKKWFYIDTTGKKVFGNYRDASSFKDSVAIVDNDSLIDKKGNIIAVSKFYIQEYEPEYKCFQVDAEDDDFSVGKWGLMDLHGKMIVDPYFYHEFDSPSDGMIAVCERVDDTMGTSQHGHVWGFVNMQGREVIPCIYPDNYDYHFSCELAAVPKDYKWIFIDKSGKQAIPFQYDYAANFVNGLARVYVNKKMEYIDTKGKVVWKEDSVGSNQ